MKVMWNVQRYLQNTMSFVRLHRKLGQLICRCHVWVRHSDWFLDGVIYFDTFF